MFCHDNGKSKLWTVLPGCTASFEKWLYILNSLVAMWALEPDLAGGVWPTGIDKTPSGLLVVQSQAWDLCVFFCHLLVGGRPEQGEGFVFREERWRGEGTSLPAKTATLELYRRATYISLCQAVSRFCSYSLLHSKLSSFLTYTQLNLTVYHIASLCFWPLSCF